MKQDLLNICIKEILKYIKLLSVSEFELKPYSIRDSAVPTEIWRFTRGL